MLHGLGKDYLAALSCLSGSYGVGLTTAWILWDERSLGVLGHCAGVVLEEAAALALQILSLSMINWQCEAERVSGLPLKTILARRA